jgi:hypothetical protein
VENTHADEHRHRASTASFPLFDSPATARRRFGLGGKISQFPHRGFDSVLQTLSGNTTIATAAVATTEGERLEDKERRKMFGKRKSRLVSATELDIGRRWRQARALLSTEGYHTEPLFEEEHERAAPCQPLQVPLKATGIALHFQRSRPLTSLFDSGL